MEQKKATTFEDLGLVFLPNSTCATCNKDDMSCHSNAIFKGDGQEYNLHISKKGGRFFKIQRTLNANSSSLDDEEHVFKVEADAVKYICENYHNFNCI
jgi:hypothetical protein